jgi:hypothetical protein
LPCWTTGRNGSMTVSSGNMAWMRNCKGLFPLTVLL